MAINFKEMGLKKILLLINDSIILILNFILCILLFIINNKEYTYRGTLRLYLFQLICIIIIIILDIIMNIANYLTDYKGHNRYGMLIRFCMFYLIIPCAVLTYQRSNNINHQDIKDSSDFVFYLGFINDGLLMVSMILSFVVIDKQTEEKILVNKSRRTINMNSVENMKLLEESKESEIFTELEKKENEIEEE